MRRILAAVLLATSVPAMTADKPMSFAVHPEASPFNASANAERDVNIALAAAGASESGLALVVMGGNWCHDSRALAGWFATPRFAKMLKARYSVVYVDIGIPQIGQGKNLHIPKRFGVKKIKGTPTVMILSADGKLLNRKDAPKWRNAASRTEDSIFSHFAEFTSP